MYMQALSKEEEKQMNKEIVNWVRKTLNGEHGTHLYNILRQLKYLMEEVNYSENSKKRRRARNLSG